MLGNAKVFCLLHEIVLTVYGLFLADDLKVIVYASIAHLQNVGYSLSVQSWPMGLNSINIWSNPVKSHLLQIGLSNLIVLSDLLLRNNFICK